MTARPVLSVLVAGSLLLFAAGWYLTINLGATGITGLPDDSDPRHAFEVTNEQFTRGPITAEIAIDAPDVGAPPVQRGIESLTASLQGDEAVGAPVFERSAAGDLALLTVPTKGDYSSMEARDALQRLREQYIPAAFDGGPAEVYVGGRTAEVVDSVKLAQTYLPIIFAFVLSASFVLLMLAFRSIVVPLKAVSMNLLSVGAAYGLLVLVFQQGIGASLFGFQQTEVIEFWLPLMMFTILFGLSTDYHVFLLSRIKERYDETGDNSGSVAYGLRATGSIITGAALIMVAVFGGFAMGDLVPMQQMGFGLAVAVILDATIIRSVLVPASMELLGDWNWYFPSWLEAGLPTWQVGYYNPKAIPNLLERDDGSYRIIDLESNLVTPFMPPAALIRAIRAGQYPSFDDIDVKRMFGYLVEHREEIIAELGREQAHELFDAAESYATAQGEWFGGEARIPSKLLRFAFRLVDVPTWVRAIRRMTGGSQLVADNFIHAGISDWAAEGHLEDREADRLHDALATPEIAAVTANLGAHMAMSIPLRFPFGSLARAIWTVVNRVKAEWRALRRRGSAATARQIHTVGRADGSGAGLWRRSLPAGEAAACPPCARGHRLRPTAAQGAVTSVLAPAPRGAPHLVRASDRQSSPPQRAGHRPGYRERLAAVNGHWRLVSAVLAVNVTVLAAATVLFQRYDASWALSEFGLLNSVDALQLLVAGGGSDHIKRPPVRSDHGCCRVPVSMRRGACRNRVLPPAQSAEQHRHPASNASLHPRFLVGSGSFAPLRQGSDQPDPMSWSYEIALIR